MMKSKYTTEALKETARELQEAEITIDEFLALFTVQQQALLDEVEKRVIGNDSNPRAYDPEFIERRDIESIKLEGENELMARQRKLLKEIKGELA